MMIASYTDDDDISFSNNFQQDPQLICSEGNFQKHKWDFSLILTLSIAPAAVSDFPELGSNLENWQLCAKLAEIAIECEPVSFDAKNATF